MKVTFEAKVTSNIQHDDDPKTGDPCYSSKLEWKRSKYSTENIWLDQFVPLGTKVIVTCDWEATPNVSEPPPEWEQVSPTPQGTSPLDDPSLDDAEAQALKQLVDGPQEPRP